MTARTIIGVDPGKQGAIALYRPDTGALTVFDVPVFTGKKTVVDHYGLARLVEKMAQTQATVWLELVGTRPGEGAVGAFDFGRTYGLLLGVCAAHYLPISFVTPATWKAALKVRGDKEVSRQRAAELFPRHGGLWPLKKHDGRAEAALIALYGARQSQPDEVAA